MLTRKTSALVLAAVLASAGAARAQSFGHPQPTREDASGAWSGGLITCASTSTTVTTGTGLARSLIVCGSTNAASGGAWVCFSQEGATPIPCTESLAAIRVTAGMCTPPITAVRGVAVSCLRDGASDAKIHFLLTK